MVLRAKECPRAVRISTLLCGWLIYFAMSLILKNSRSIRVGFVLHSMHVAGAEMLVVKIIQRLQAKILPIVFCLDSIGDLGRQLQSQGIDVLCLNRRPGRDWGLVWRFAQVLRRHRIDIVHAHQYTPFFYSALANLFNGRRARIIFTEHGRHFPDLVSPVRRALNRLVFDQLADSVNAVCKFSARSLCRIDGFSGGRIAVIPNGIEFDRYDRSKDRGPLRKQLGWHPNRRYVVNIARCHPVKDQAMLLNAFREVAERRQDVDLVIAGDGVLKPDLQALANRLRIDSRVHFLGIRNDVPLLLSAADLFILTSVSEAASLTLLEAMAARLPVVVTNVGGNPEMVRDHVEGLLVPRGDARAAAKAMLEILDNSRLSQEMGMAGHARVGQRYRLDQCVAQYLALYERLRGCA